ncbi:hypothetical protein FGO68_gene6881 [Halteria grandinella]|uniref:Uncharacterized protein n=1 Tax=Halteria grandinella TaxID=5974 RepID=A0A8J8TAQ3_HALGN|nr:hypothetical protein FGO68_gene6881 [Halteria grandinella]
MSVDVLLNSDGKKMADIFNGAEIKAKQLILEKKVYSMKSSNKSRKYSARFHSIRVSSGGDSNSSRQNRFSKDSKLAANDKEQDMDDAFFFGNGSANNSFDKKNAAYISTGKRRNISLTQAALMDQGTPLSSSNNTNRSKRSCASAASGRRGNSTPKQHIDLLNDDFDDEVLNQKHLTLVREMSFGKMIAGNPLTQSFAPIMRAASLTKECVEDDKEELTDEEPSGRNQINNPAGAQDASQGLQMHLPYFHSSNSLSDARQNSNRSSHPKQNQQQQSTHTLSSFAKQKTIKQKVQQSQSANTDVVVQRKDNDAISPLKATAAGIYTASPYQESTSEKIMVSSPAEEELDQSEESDRNNNINVISTNNNNHLNALDVVPEESESMPSQRLSNRTSKASQDNG